VYYNPVSKKTGVKIVVLGVGAQGLIKMRKPTHIITSGVTNGGQGSEPPPGKLNKNCPPLVDILMFSIL